jgi:hypothetical protein
MRLREKIGSGFFREEGGFRVAGGTGSGIPGGNEGGSEKCSGEGLQKMTGAWQELLKRELRADPYTYDKRTRNRSGSPLFYNNEKSEKSL